MTSPGKSLINSTTLMDPHVPWRVVNCFGFNTSNANGIVKKNKTKLHPYLNNKHEPVKKRKTSTKVEPH